MQNNLTYEESYSKSFISIVDIVSRDIFLYLLSFASKNFDYFDHNVDRIRSEISEIFDKKIHIVDDKLWYCLVDDKLHFANFGISGRKYMILTDNIYISNHKTKYISITHKSDNIYDIKTSNNQNTICNYQNCKFIPNLYLNTQNYISKIPVIKQVDSQKELKSIFIAKIERIKLWWYFVLNSCFARTMLMLDYCKQQSLNWNLIIDIYKTNKLWYNPNDTSTHFGIEIDWVGVMQYIWDNWWSYKLDPTYIFDEQWKQNISLHKIPFDKISDKDNIVSILEIVSFDKQEIYDWIDARISQLYNYHKSISVV